MSLNLSHSQLANLHAHLEKGYPYEACGILIGEISSDNVDKRVHDVVLVENSWTPDAGVSDTRRGQDESQHNRFLIAPEDMARADREAGKRGLDIIGFFHSHPDSPSVPSETDREWAWPVIAFMIVRVQDGKATTTQSWILRDDRTRFDEEAVRVIA